MFFTDEDGINRIQFGTGDIEVAPGLLDLPEETIGCICLTPQKERPIGEIGARGEVCADNCIAEEVHTMLQFTKVESIDVVVQKLLECRKMMVKDGRDE